MRGEGRRGEERRGEERRGEERRGGKGWTYAQFCTVRRPLGMTAAAPAGPPPAALMEALSAASDWAKEAEAVRAAPPEKCSSVSSVRTEG
jgi:hypothetical protein